MREKEKVMTVAELKNAADRGDTLAQFDLAVHYLRQKNDADAEKYFTLAANSPNSQRMSDANLQLVILYGKKLEASGPQAVEANTTLYNNIQRCYSKVSRYSLHYAEALLASARFYLKPPANVSPDPIKAFVRYWKLVRLSYDVPEKGEALRLIGRFLGDDYSIQVPKEDDAANFVTKKTFYQIMRHCYDVGFIEPMEYETALTETSQMKPGLLLQAQIQLQLMRVYLNLASAGNVFYPGKHWHYLALARQAFSNAMTLPNINWQTREEKYDRLKTIEAHIDSGLEDNGLGKRFLESFHAMVQKIKIPFLVVFVFAIVTAFVSIPVSNLLFLMLLLVPPAKTNSARPLAISCAALSKACMPEAQLR